MADSVIEFLRHSRKKERASYRYDTKEINLSGKSIFEINLERVGDLSELQTLDISNNKLERIDLDFLSNCSELRTIDLGDNRIQNFDTQAFKNFAQLEEFLLSNNLIKKVDLDGLKGCNRLEVLNLSNNHMHEIDISFLETCPSLTILNLQNNQIDRIEIKALENCKLIQVLDLSHNWIREIDLVPLSKSKNLIHVDLSQNPLGELDLTPLNDCHALVNLILDWTQILKLDLSPLSECHNLRTLGISHNRVDEIDLYPLLGCPNLESLDISAINALEIDLWPLFSLPLLNKFIVSRRTKLEIQGPPNSIPWSRGLDGIQERTSSMDVESVIREIGLSGFIEEIRALGNNANPLGKFYLHLSIMESFGFEHLRGFDGDLLVLLESIEDTNDFQVVQSKFQILLLSQLEAQLANNGPTYFLDVEKSRVIPELAVMASKVVDLRKQEVESLQLIRTEGRIDLIPLWETSYGFEMLSALCLGMSSDQEGLNLIRGELAKLGIELKAISDTEDSPRESKLSEGLREYILMRAIQCSHVMN